MEIRFKKQVPEYSPEVEGSKRGRRPKKAKTVRAKGKRFIMIIGDEGAILVFMEGMKVVRRLFAPSPQPSHSEVMMEIMRTNPAVPISVLADVMDQQYVAHTFPPVSAMSVGGLVTRRLSRDFQPEDLKGALRLGRDKTGRKEWRYLLVALVKTPLMAAWLDMLMELPNTIEGIYLTPVEAVNYVSMLGKKLEKTSPRPWQMLITHNKVSGFRQVIMREGKLVFTRVSLAIDDAIPAVIAGNIEQEIINTMEYLKRLEFPSSADMDATVIVSQDVIESLDLNRFGFARTDVLTPMAVAEALGLDQAALSADRFGDVVMAAAHGVQKKHVLRFSNAYIEKLDKLIKINLAIRAGSGLVATILLGLTGWSLFGVVNNYSRIAEVEQKARTTQTALQSAQKSVEGLNKDVAFQSVVVAGYDAYMKDALKPEDFVKAIAPYLSPQQRITYWSWNAVQAEENTSTPAPPPAAGATEKLPLKVEMTADFSGAGGTLDVVDKAANSFFDAIRMGMPQYNLTVERLPWKKEDAQSEEIALEVNAPSAVQVVDATVKFNLSGPKKLDASPPAPAAAGHP